MIHHELQGRHVRGQHFGRMLIVAPNTEMGVQTNLSLDRLNIFADQLQQGTLTCTATAWWVWFRAQILGHRWLAFNRFEAATGSTLPKYPPYRSNMRETAWRVASIILGHRLFCTHTHPFHLHRRPVGGSQWDLFGRPPLGLKRHGGRAGRMPPRSVVLGAH